MNFEDACKPDDKTHGAMPRQHSAASFFLSLSVLERPS